MTTRTDYNSLQMLENFRPKRRAFINAAEARQISDALELSARNEIELHNVRNAAVMMYDIRTREALEQEDGAEAARLMDIMSAICAVIDDRLWRMGCEV